MKTKYGSFSKNQISETKKYIRKSIFFLLLYVDPKTKDSYKNIDVDTAFLNLLYKLDGLNSILLEPPELVIVMSLLEFAWKEYNSNDFDFNIYRKLILDAGAEIMCVKDGD